MSYAGPLAAAPGHMGVDFEERVDFARLRDYRLAPGPGGAGRERAAGPFLLFDFNNIRYMTSTMDRRVGSATR